MTLKLLYIVKNGPLPEACNKVLEKLTELKESLKAMGTPVEFADLYNPNKFIAAYNEKFISEIRDMSLNHKGFVLGDFFYNYLNDLKLIDEVDGSLSFKVGGYAHLFVAHG